MSCLMWIGSGVNLFCWLPLEMWCLSAWSMTCVMIRFAPCTSVGAGSKCMACSISCVKACLFAFLVVCEGGFSGACFCRVWGEGGG